MADKVEHYMSADPTPEGVMLIRFEKRTIDAQGNITRQYHRTSVEPGMTVDAQMALVTPHLAQLGYAVPDAASMGELRRRVEAVHTPAVVARYRADQAAAAMGKKG